MNNYLRNIVLLLFLLLLMVLGLWYLIPQSNKSNILENKNESNLNVTNVNTANAQSLFDNANFKELNALADSKLALNNKDIEALMIKASSLAQEASLTFKEKELGDQARKYVLEVLKLDPKNVQALTLLGYTYEIQEDYVNAHKYYDEALKIDPNNTNTLTQKAHAYDLEGKIKEAEGLFAKISDKSTYSEIRYAKILLYQGKVKEAKELLNKNLPKLTNKREVAEVLYILTQLEESKDYSLKLENSYLKIIETDPTFALGYVGLAKEQFKKSAIVKSDNERKELIDKSFLNLEKALKIHKNNATAKLQLLMQMYSIGQIDLATKIYKNMPETIKNDITLGENQKNSLYLIVESLKTNFK